MTVDGITRVDVAGFEGVYCVDTEGTVYRYLVDGSLKVMKGNISDGGYVSVKLSDTRNNKQRYVLVHILVAETFIDNPNGYPQVDHRNEDKEDNAINNLRWCTHKMNSDYYHNKDGRKYYGVLKTRYRKLIREAVQGIREDTAANENSILNLQEMEKNVDKRITRKYEELETAITKFEKYKEVEMNKIKALNTSATEYHKDKVKATTNSIAKPVTVDGKVFASSRKGAAYILDKELVLGNVKRKDTVAKELRRFVSGERPSWVMYGRYTIGY